MRLNNGAEVLQYLSSVELFTKKSGTAINAVTNAIIATGASVLPFAALPTNAADGDYIVTVGSGGPELNQVLGSPAASLPITYKTAIAQAAGATVVEMDRADLGHVESAGLTLSTSLELTAVNAATSRVPIAYRRGAGELSAKLSLYGANLENLALFFGVDASAVSGAGTSTDPYQLAVTGQTLGTHGLMCMRGRGVREDLGTVLVDINGVTIQPTGDIVIGAGPTTIPVSLKFLNVIARQYN